MKRISAFLLSFLVFSFAGIFAKPLYYVEGHGAFRYPVTPDESKKFLDEYEPGFSFGGSFEIRPFKFMGLSLNADFGTLNPVLENLPEMQLNSYYGGIKFILPFMERYEVSLSGNGGMFQAKRNTPFGGVYAGAALEGEVKISPSLAFLLGGSYNYYIHKQFPFSDVKAFMGFRVNLKNFFSKEGVITYDVHEMNPIFPVLYSRYNENPFGTIEIFNEEDASIKNVQVSFYQEEYMNSPKLYKTIEKIPVGGSEVLDLTAFFNENILSLIEPVRKNSELHVSYSLINERREVSVPLEVSFLNRNNLSWEDDRRAAVFVSPNDSEVKSYVKDIRRIVRDKINPNKNQNLQMAMALFESLSIFGLNYVIDPASSYTANVGTTSVDFLQFPYQTLNYRGGDCDDLSILYTSLLEACGIEGAFITVPGHIYTGICVGQIDDERAFEEEPVLVGSQVFYEGKIWQPLEITMLKDGFDRAMAFGVEEWKKYADEARIYPMHSNWELYRSESSPEKKADISFTKDEALLKRFLLQQKKLK